MILCVVKKIHNKITIQNHDFVVLRGCKKTNNNKIMISLWCLGWQKNIQQNRNFVVHYTTELQFHCDKGVQKWWYNRNMIMWEEQFENKKGASSLVGTNNKWNETNSNSLRKITIEVQLEKLGSAKYQELILSH